MKPILLFPCSPLNGLKRVDEDFQQEFDAATQVGFRTVLFDHDKLVKEGKAEFNAPLPYRQELILRGWMLTLDQYAKLFSACNDMLITTPEEYEEKHYWPIAYQKHQILCRNSPHCMWTDSRDFSVKHIKQEFGGRPILVKDHVKSAKGSPNAMFIKNSASKQEVFTVIHNMINERGSLFQRGIVLKEQVSIQKDAAGNAIEFRIFYLKGNPISVESNGCEWDYLRAQMLSSSSMSPLIKQIGESLGNGFYTVDLMLSDGKWLVIECGDGQVSGLAAKASPFVFYGKLMGELMRGKPKEEVLDDDYKVYPDYFYVADGKVIRSNVSGRVSDLRRDLEERGISASEITTCDVFARMEQR